MCVAAAPADRHEESFVRHTKKIGITVVATGAAWLAAFAPAAQGATVCNEAENSPRGGYEVTGGIVDPAPPAFLRDSQMRVGNGDSAGLDHAADVSPALRQCAPEDDGDPTGGGDDGGGDTGGGDDGGVIDS